jgi:peptidyl-prolyl cis-trans isomerase D
MLDFLRKRKRSWVVIFLLLLVIVVFVLFYGGKRLNEQAADEVMKINGETISRREFALHFQRVLDQYRELFKGSLTEELIRELKLKNKVLDELIQRRLLLQETRRLALDATEEELSEAIARMPEFQVDGRFSKNRYLQIMRQSRIAPGQFEAERGEQIAIQKLYDLVQDALEVTEEEVREQYRVREERVNFSFIRLAPGDFVAQVKLTEEEIKNYYERSKDTLKEPLKVQVEYVSYPFDQFGSQLKVSEKEIEDAYNLRRAKFFEPRSLKLRHIFVRIPPGGDLKQKESAQQRAEAALQEARAGKDFASLAKKYSDDASAAQGGDLGWVKPGQLFPAIEQALGGLKKGAVTRVVESPAGYHIVKIEEVKEEKTTGLKEATPEILRALRAEKGRAEAARAADADREKVASGADLATIATERKLAFEATPYFGPEDVPQGLSKVEALERTPFSLAVKELSSPIETATSYVLLRVKDRKESTLLSIEAARPRIEKRLKQVKALELVKQKGQALLEQLKKERDIQKVAKEQSVQVGETGWFPRSASDMPKIGPLLDGKPESIALSRHQPVADRPYAQKEALYILAFKASQGADMDLFAKQKGRIMEQALAEKRQKALARLVDSLKAKAKIDLQSSFVEEG